MSLLLTGCMHFLESVLEVNVCRSVSPHRSSRASVSKPSSITESVYMVSERLAKSARTAASKAAASGRPTLIVTGTLPSSYRSWRRLPLGAFLRTKTARVLLNRFPFVAFDSKQRCSKTGSGLSYCKVAKVHNCATVTEGWLFLRTARGARA